MGGCASTRDTRAYTLKDALNVMVDMQDLAWSGRAVASPTLGHWHLWCLVA